MCARPERPQWALRVDLPARPLVLGSVRRSSGHAQPAQTGHSTIVPNAAAAAIIAAVRVAADNARSPPFSDTPQVAQLSLSSIKVDIAPFVSAKTARRA